MGDGRIHQFSDEGRMHQFPHAKKLHEKGTDRYIDGHCDSMKESAKGQFFENPLIPDNNLSLLVVVHFW